MYVSMYQGLVASLEFFGLVKNKVVGSFFKD